MDSSLNHFAKSLPLPHSDFPDVGFCVVRFRVRYRFGVDTVIKVRFSMK
jgi:hypothetical protein